jgi:hypothetical protein
MFSPSKCCSLSDNKQDYYYAYFGKDISPNAIDKSKIISFRQHQEQLTIQFQFGMDDSRIYHAF